MAFDRPIRLLLATSFPEVEAGVRHALAGGGQEAEIEVCHSVSELFDALEQGGSGAERSVSEPERSEPERTGADVLLLAEDGLPGRALERIREACLRLFRGPVLLLGSMAEDRSKLHLLRRRGPEFVPSEELHRLPVAIERALRQQDVRETERRMREEISRAADTVGKTQKLVTIGRLAGSIAHEINNPLESITNLLYLTANEPGLPSQARQYLNLAQAELDRVVEISKQTLTFNRETAQPALLHVPDLLDEVLALYARRIAEKKIRVEREYRSNSRVLAHPGEVRQVFSNLVSNAIEAMEPQGRLRLRVRSSAHWRDGAMPGVRISVADTGGGIPAEARQRLGEPFFTTKGQSGTGLGLWVSHSIVRRYGGSLNLRSCTGEDHGTVFTVFLPASAGQEDGSKGVESGCLTIDRAPGSGQLHQREEKRGFESRVVGIK